jgi:outer membrane protein insertion porin family
MKFKSLLFFYLVTSIQLCVFSQPFRGNLNLDYTQPQEYEIGDITVTGIEYLDQDALIAITGLKKGDKITIPGETLSNAIKKLWDNGLVGDVQVSATKVEGNIIYLNFALKERPRLSRFIFTGIKKSEQQDLKEKIDHSRGTIVNDALVKNIQKKVKTFYLDKGYLNTQVNISRIKDTLFGNNIILKVDVNKQSKVRIHNVIFEGNETFDDKKLKKKMKKTKEKRFYKIFTSAKFIRKEYDEDKQKILDFYNGAGYRDVEITDSIRQYDGDKLDIILKVDEGKRYYFRNITWKGNYIQADSTLDQILGIKKGTPYSSELLQKKLNYNPSGIDISSLYLDNGYLFFSVDPVEVLVEGDSIDIEMRIFEGTQAMIDQITVSGNTKTHDHVILRELYTLPGQKFSRTDLIRSQMALAQMGYFDTDQLGVNPIPNPQKGTVDIHYTVAEKPSDQIELSGGWGGNFGFIGTVGLVFNNFSIKKIPDVKSWSPLPAGDGQRLALRFQASGRQYQTLTLSFTEPWLGGKKPNSLTTSVSYSRQATLNPDGSVHGHLGVTGVSVGLGRRLLKFIDNFSVQQTVSYYHYSLKNFASDLGFPNGTGGANNISFINSISRYNIHDNQSNNPIFPLSGSNTSLTLTLTPPYSLFFKPDPSNPYKFVEFHKWMIDNDWYVPIIPHPQRSLVLRVGTHFGLIGSYKASTLIGPFERFKVGGSGLSGFNFLLGSDVIGLRGFRDNSILATDQNGRTISYGGIIYDKLTFELRYPIHLSSAFSVFTVGWLEAGNNWGNFKDFNPFNVYRALGGGLRLSMPAFGQVGLDYGWPLDLLPGQISRQGQFTFTIGQQIR